jgi:hypothetical protein
MRRCVWQEGKEGFLLLMLGALFKELDQPVGVVVG